MITASFENSNAATLKMYKTVNCKSDYDIDIYCGLPTNLGLLGSLSVVSRGSTIRHLVITKSRLMIKFGRVAVTTKLSQLS